MKIYSMPVYICALFTFTLLWGFPLSTVPKPEQPDFRYILEAFPVNETELTEDQKELLMLAADELESIISSGKKKCLRIVGHAATWRNISDQTYCERSLERAKNAGAFLSGIFQQESDHTVAYLAEDQVGLGRTVDCTGTSKKFCKPDLDADVTIVWGGRADSEPLVDNLVHSTSTQARENRTRNRRVEITFVDQKISDTPFVCKKLTKGQLRQYTRAVLNLKPKRFAPAKELYGFVKEGYDSPVCKNVRKLLKRADPETNFLGTSACVLMERYAEVMKDLFASEDPLRYHGTLMGSAYAIVDGPDHRDRSLEPLGRKFRNSVKTGKDDRERYREGFNVGFQQTQLQLKAIKRAIKRSGNQSAKAALDNIYEGIHCKKGARAVAVKHVYDTLLEHAQNNGGKSWQRANSFLSAAGNCGFTYPEVSFHHCGPMQ